MPNFLAHHLFVKDFFLENNQNLKYEDRRFLKNNFFFLMWGSQGPDPLFYNGLSFSNGIHLVTALKKVGNKLHKDDFNKLLEIMIDELKNVKDENKDSIKCFILGQFAHYLLDSTTHPFILYESGFNEEGRIKGKYHYKHAHFEMLIDYNLATCRNMDFFKKYPYLYLTIDKDKLKIIDSFMYRVLKRFFPEYKLYKNIYSSGAKNMFKMIKYINTGTPFRTFIFKGTSLAAMRIDKKGADDDILNLKNDIWLDPVTGDKSNLSFIDLYNEAYKKLNDVYLKIKDKDNLDVTDFKNCLNGLDYYGKKKDEKLIYHKENIKTIEKLKELNNQVEEK